MLRCAEAVGAEHEGDPGAVGGLLVSQGIADVNGVFDTVLLHQLQDGPILAGTGVSEAQVAGNIIPDAQLADTQLRVAGLAVADDEQPVTLAQLRQSLLHLGIAYIAGVILDVAVLRVHAAKHQRLAFLCRQAGEQSFGDLRHHLAKEGLQIFSGHLQVAQTLFFQLDVIALRHDGPGIPQRAVNIKNQTFKLHSRSPPNAAGCGP